MHPEAANPRPPADPPIPRALGARELRAVLACVLLALGLGAAAVLALSVAFTPEELGAGALQRSLGFEARACTGCSLCGLSRAFAHTSRGELRSALTLNPGVIVAFPAAAALVASLPWAWRAAWRARRSGRCAS